MTKALVIASHKGGTGKTTTAATLGAGLALRGFRVLVVDLDAQGNLADFLGQEPAPGLFRLLIERAPLAEVVIPSGRPNLDILPGNYQTAEAAALLVAAPGVDTRLKRALAGAPYDWLLFDTAPSLGLLQTLAFVAGDLLLVPTELAFASGLGVAQVLRTVAALRQDVDLALDLVGILPTKWDRRLSESAAQLKALADRYPGRVWLPIPTDAKVTEAPAFGQTLWEYAPSCAALVGRESDGQMIGGYGQALDRLLAEVKR